MATASSDLVLGSLYELIERLEDGARLPTVRALMKTFRVSQPAVQGAFERLQAEGLVRSQVGRGSYVVKPAGGTPGREGARAGPSSLLILSNASMNERCVLVQNRIIAAMAGHGGKVVQMSYHDSEHLLELLGPVPRFDAAILQSHYESIPVRLLNLLQTKSRALVVDGHSIAGLDIDRVGTDWVEAMELALEHLLAQGHRRIGLVATDTGAQPILAARRAFGRLARFRGASGIETATVLLEGVRHPTQSIGDKLERALAGLGGGAGRLPFTAALLLGISDGIGVLQCLERLGLAMPGDLAVCLLGHRDVPTEHFGVLTMAGSSHAEAADRLVDTIRRRLAAPGLPPQIEFLDSGLVARRSTGAAPEG